MRHKLSMNTGLYIVLFIGVNVLLAAGTMAQSTTRYGLKIGMSISDVTDNIEDVYGRSSPRYGVTLGGSALIPFFGPAYIQPELLLVQRGANDAKNSNLELHLSYIDIPLLLKFKLSDRYRVCPGIYAGPALNLLTGSTLIYGTQRIDASSEITNFDFSIILGAGVDIGSAEGAFTMEGRYIIGFESIDDRRGEPMDIRNRSYSFLVGYLF